MLKLLSKQHETQPVSWHEIQPVSWHEDILVLFICPSLESRIFGEHAPFILIKPQKYSILLKLYYFTSQPETCSYSPVKQVLYLQIFLIYAVICQKSLILYKISVQISSIDSIYIVCFIWKQNAKLILIIEIIRTFMLIYS